MDRQEAKFRIKKTCGRGWLPLVDVIFDRLPGGIEIASIYQKWGALTVDIEPKDVDFQAFLQDTSTKSTKICEICGTITDISFSHQADEIRTLCQKCAL